MESTRGCFGQWFHANGGIGFGRVRAAQHVVEIFDLVCQHMQFGGKPLYLGFGAAVDGVVEFAAQAIFHVLTILAHHDDRRLDGGEHG